jgi:hypothetical protein
MIGITWTGWDGSVWDLRTGGVRLTNGGIQGLSVFKFDSFTTDSAARDGQRYQGYRAQPRSVLLPVMVGSTTMTELEYLATEKAWFKTMRPGMYGTLTVTTPDGGSRWLKLRFEDDGDATFAIDPTRNKLTIYALKLIADDPYWYGPDPWSLSFAPSANQQSFFGGKPVGASYAWVGAEYQSRSTETINGVTRTNLAPYPSTRARKGWDPVLIGGMSTVQSYYTSGDGPPVEADYERIVVSAAGAYQGDVGASQPITGLTPGSPYTFSGWVRFNRARQGRVYITWLNNSGSSLGDAAGDPITVGTSWARVSYTATPPTGAVSAIVRLTALYHQPSVGDWYDAAALLVESGTTVGDYFHGNSGKGTPFYISSSFTTDGATLTNDGDVDAYPIYTMTGPLTAFRITNNGAVLAGSVTVNPDQRLVIDTSPIMQTAYLYKADGSYTNVLSQLTSFGFKAIRPGTDIKLGVKLTGVGTLTVSGQPRYFKAW